MFVFQNDFRGVDADSYNILLQEGSLPGGTAQMGNAQDLFMSQPSPKYHLIGHLVVMHNVEGDRERKKVLLACREGLTDEQREALVTEMQLLVGTYTGTGGALRVEEHVKGWWAADDMVYELAVNK